MDLPPCFCTGEICCIGGTAKSAAEAPRGLREDLVLELVARAPQRRSAHLLGARGIGDHFRHFRLRCQRPELQSSKRAVEQHPRQLE